MVLLLTVYLLQLSGVYTTAQRSAAAVGCRYGFVFAAGSGILVHLVYAAASLVAQGVPLHVVALYNVRVLQPRYHRLMSFRLLLFSF